MPNKKMNLEDTLVRHLPLQAAAQQPDVFGLEVELEGKGIRLCPQDVDTFWQKHEDNSLRKLKPGDDAVEYVFSQPLRMQLTEEAIGRLFRFLNGPDVQVYESYRTSIHVHINFGVEKFRTIYNFMVISLILDELMVSQNGSHRIGNNFCLRAKDALGQVVAIIQSIQNNNNFFSMGGNNHRYSSINFNSLLKFGSIEFRSMECTTHEGRVMHWINTLNHMKQSAKRYKNPVEVISEFSKLGPIGFLHSVLGPFALKYQSVDGASEMLRNGMRIAQDLAYCSTWEEIDPTTSAKEMAAAKAQMAAYQKAYGDVNQ